MDDKKIIKRFYSVIFGLVLMFFSCQTENKQEDRIDFLRPNVELKITTHDTLLFLNKSELSERELKCELLNGQFLLKPEKHKFLGVDLKIEPNVKMKNVYQLVGMLQSIGYYSIYFSVLGQSDKVVKYRAPNNFKYFENNQIDCFSIENYGKISFNHRRKPPGRVPKSELPTCFLLVVTKNGNLSVEEMLFTEETYREYISKQFINSNKTIVGLEIANDLEFRNYFKTMSLIYGTIDHLRNKEAKKKTIIKCILN